MLARLRLLQIELGPARDHVMAVVHEVLQQLLQVQDLRHAAHQGEHDGSERRLHLRVLVQLIQHDRRVGIPAQLDHDPHAVPVGLVPQIRDVRDLLVAHQVGDLLDQARLVDLEGDLRHDDLRLAARGLLLDLRPRPHDDAAAPGPVALVDAVAPVHEAARREVRTPDMSLQLRHVAVRVVHQMLHRRRDLREVVGRHVGGHADGDARRAVDEQVGEPRRQDRGLLEPVVEVGRELDGVLVDVVQHRHRQRREAGFRVAVGRRAVAVHRPEVPLAVHERIAKREVLGHAHQRVVDGRVAVGVVLAQDLADHRRRLLVRPVGLQPELAHGVEDPPVYGFQPVARVGEGTLDDDAHRVVDERLLHLVLDEAGENAFALVRSGHVHPCRYKNRGRQGPRMRSLQYTAPPSPNQSFRMALSCCEIKR